MEIKDFESAKLYMDIGRYESAQHCFENVLKDYPETQRGEEIRYLMAKSQYEYATRSYVTRQLERFEKDVELIELFLSRYPESKYAEEMRVMLEKDLERLKELQDVRY
jgi:outer membrane protein assembly factor BamD